MIKSRITKSTQVLVIGLGLSLTCAAQRYPGPLSPEESLKKINVAKGFKVEIYAAEPFVLDPVDLQFDEDGNAYIVQMPDYPFEVEPGKGSGQIRILKDTDGDGRVDKSVIFATNVTEGTSILRWKGGIIATAAPNILYLKDTDGDGKADVREILFSGFFQNNSEAQITSLRFGVDNWIYANNRGQAGMVKYSKKPGTPPVSVQGADFRFRLDRDQFELETGPGQFGQTIDDWGHRFFTENSIHLQQAIIPWRYTHRHAFLPTSKFNVSITDHEELMFQETPAPYWRAERTRQRNKMYKEANMNRVEYEDDHFTGASGGTIYNGNGLPAEFYGNLFTTDVSGNLVHRDILKPDSKIPALIASRAATEKDREFLYSTDTWFRPITLGVGPDGYLYVLDYYRQHIETPVSIPDELKADMNFTAGNDKGRIYRVLPEGSTYKPVTVNMSKMTSAQLVGLLDNPNGWYGVQAHRLLVERQDKTVIPAITTHFTTSKDARGRLHALYVLEALSALNVQLVKHALKDPSEGVRENAIILAERYPECLPLVAEMISDPSNRVALQATLSVGEFKGPAVIAALAKAVEKYGSVSWFRSAVISSNAGSSPELGKALSAAGFFQKEEPWKLSFIEDLSYVIGARNTKAQVSAYLTALGAQNGAWLASGVNGLAKGITKSPTANALQKAAVPALKSDSDQSARQSVAILKKLYL